ncbi:MAG: Ig-like domain-containing protein, partial [Propionibacteriaceae bacterium]|nr:Ig-like domain-containing protein [Propionibacteriaceae bacterium]
PVTTALPEGPVPLVVTQTDPAGHQSAPDTVTPYLDTQVPGAPTVTWPAAGAAVGDATPTLTGTGEPGATVTVKDGNGTTLCTTTVPQAGTWSCPVTTALPEGPATLVVTQTDQAGHESAPTGVAVTVDTTPPAPPVIQVADVQSVAGTADPGTTLTVAWPDGTTDTVTAGPTGHWSVTTPADMTSGTVTVIAQDAAGNASTPATVHLDLDAPDAPTITTANATTVAGTVPTPVTAGTTVTLTYPTASGTATVTTDVDPLTGDWSLPTPADATSGPVSARATSPTGVVSSPGTATLDVTAPAAPVVISPAAGATVGDDTPTIRGTGEAGATVTVADAAGQSLCTATVAPGGTWSCAVAPALDEGPVQLSITQTDPAGNPSPATTLTVTVDVTAPAAPVVTAPADGATVGDTPTIRGTGEVGATVTVADAAGTALCSTTVQPDSTWTCTVPASHALADGPQPFTVTQADTAGNVSAAVTVTPVVDTAPLAGPTITEPANGDIISGALLMVKGTGKPGATLTVSDKLGHTLCTTTVAADGMWACEVTIPAVAGPVELVATQTDDSGRTSGPAVVTPVVEAEVPAAPTVTTANATTITGTAPSGTMVTVTYPKADGTNGTVTAQVPSSGTWSLPTPADAASGPVTAVATDAHGTQSPPVTAQLDVDIPAAPVVGTPRPGAVLGDPTPVVTGTGEPGARVTVTDADGTALCTTSVLPSGAWTCTVQKPLSDGAVELRVTQTDPAGNASAPTVVTVTVSTKVPGVPAITTANATTVAGTAEPGGTVTVTYPKADGTTGTVTARVGSSGTWSIATPADAVAGAITAVVTDAAGHTSARATATLDPTPPAPPVVDPSTGPDLTGSGEPGGAVTVTVDSRPVPGCEGLTVKADGTFACRPTPPLKAGDQVAVTVTDGAGNVSAPTVIEIGQLTIAVTYPVRHRLETEVVTGGHFRPGESVTLTVQSQPITMGKAVAGSDGTVTFTFTVPADLALGEHTATLTGDQSGAVSATFTVTAAPAAPTGGTAESSLSWPLAGLALAGLVLAVGTWFTWARPRPRPTP